MVKGAAYGVHRLGMAPDSVPYSSLACLIHQSPVVGEMFRLVDVAFCSISDGVGERGLLGFLPCPMVRLQAHVIAGYRATPELSPW